MSVAPTFFYTTWKKVELDKTQSESASNDNKANEEFRSAQKNYNSSVSIFNQSLETVNLSASIFNNEVVETNAASVNYQQDLTEVINLNNTINTLKTTIKDTESKIATYEGEIATSYQRVDELNGLISGKESQIAAEEAKIQREKDLRTRKTNMENDYNWAVANKDSLYNGYTQLESQVTSKTAAITNVDMQIANIESALASGKTTADIEYKDENGNVIKIQANTQLSDAQKTALQNQLNILKQEKAKLQGELQTLTQQRDTAYNEYNRAVAAIDDYTANYATVCADLTQAETEKAEAEQALPGLRQELEALQEERSQELEKIEEYEAKMSDDIDKMVENCAELAVLETRLEIAEEEEDKSYVALEKEIKDLNRAEDDLDPKAANQNQLKTSLDSARSELERIAQSLGIKLESEENKDKDKRKQDLVA